MSQLSKLTRLCVALLVACLALAQLSGAEEVPETAPKSASSDNEPSPTQVNSEEGVTGNVVEPGANSPGTTATQAKTLGDAFKNFRPSEEISADNPVPFPVDI